MVVTPGVISYTAAFSACRWQLTLFFWSWLNTPGVISYNASLFERHSNMISFTAAISAGENEGQWQLTLSR